MRILTSVWLWLLRHKAVSIVTFLRESDRAPALAAYLKANRDERLFAELHGSLAFVEARRGALRTIKDVGARESILPLLRLLLDEQPTHSGDLPEGLRLTLDAIDKKWSHAVEIDQIKPALAEALSRGSTTASWLLQRLSGRIDDEFLIDTFKSLDHHAGIRVAIVRLMSQRTSENIQDLMRDVMKTSYGGHRSASQMPVVAAVYLMDHECEPASLQAAWFVLRQVVIDGHSFDTQNPVEAWAAEEREGRTAIERALAVCGEAPHASSIEVLAYRILQYAQSPTGQHSSYWAGEVYSVRNVLLLLLKKLRTALPQILVEKVSHIPDFTRRILSGDKWCPTSTDRSFEFYELRLAVAAIEDTTHRIYCGCCDETFPFRGDCAFHSRELVEITCQRCRKARFRFDRKELQARDIETYTEWGYASVGPRSRRSTTTSQEGT